MKEISDANETQSVKIQEAELQVQTYISVRENYLSKIHSLVNAILSSSVGSLGISNGKEIHTLGDWLLIVRAASVNVVESIQHWRKEVHQAKPQPYYYKGTNYLLRMCEDMDFLDQAEEVVAWLGFRLVRNPFVISESLDYVMAERLDEAKEIQSTRSLGYFTTKLGLEQEWFLHKTKSSRNSSNNKTAKNSAKGPAKSIEKPKNPSNHQKPRWNRDHAPSMLVRPLISILPEDDPVHGTRLANAQWVLLEEESLYGRYIATQIAEKYLENALSRQEEEKETIKQDQDHLTSLLISVVKKNEKKKKTDETETSIYSEIAKLTACLKQAELQLKRLEKENKSIDLLVKDLDYQLKWTTQLFQQNDQVLDHCIWSFKENRRIEFIRRQTHLIDQLKALFEEKACEIHELKALGKKQQAQMAQLVREKEETRRVHKAKEKTKQKEKEDIRQKTRRRIVVDLTLSKKNPKNPKNPKKQKKQKKPKQEEEEEEAIALVVQEETSVIHKEEFNQVLVMLSTTTIFQEEQKKLELKRQENLNKKDKQHLLQKAFEMEKNKKRFELCCMKQEDNWSQLMEFNLRQQNHQKKLEQKRKKVTKLALFRCLQRINGRLLQIVLYEQEPQGYLLEGIRLTAYDANTSETFVLYMSTKEFYRLGYGKTNTGLDHFCQWLCLVYEKRKRLFQLVWSGPTCPPPMRVNEMDETLWCLQKEGIKMPGTYGYWYCAVFLRTNKKQMLHLTGHSLSQRHEADVDNLQNEETIQIKELVQQALYLHEDRSDMSLKWKHPIQEIEQVIVKLSSRPTTSSIVSAPIVSTSKMCVYSGEIPFNMGNSTAPIATVVPKNNYYQNKTQASPTASVHLYKHQDDGNMMFTIELIPPKNQSTEILSRQFISLQCCQVNPIHPQIELPTEAYADFVRYYIEWQDLNKITMSDVTLEQFDAKRPSDMSLSCKVDTIKWKAKLESTYFRKLKLGQFGYRFSLPSSVGQQNKQKSKFYMAKVSICQLKTQYRSHLIVDLFDILDNKRQVLCMPLSRLLRCCNVMRNILQLTSDQQCLACIPSEESTTGSSTSTTPSSSRLSTPSTKKTVSTSKSSASSAEPEEEMNEDHLCTCASCQYVYDTRLQLVQKSLERLSTATFTAANTKGNSMRRGIDAVISQVATMGPAITGVVDDLGSMFHINNTSDTDSITCITGMRVAPPPLVICIGKSHLGLVDFFESFCGCYDFQELVPFKRMQHDLLKDRMLLFYNVDIGVSMSSAKNFYKVLKRRRLGIFQSIFLIDVRQGLIPRPFNSSSGGTIGTANNRPDLSSSLSKRRFQLLRKESSQLVRSVKDQDILQHFQALSNIITQEMAPPPPPTTTAPSTTEIEETKESEQKMLELDTDLKNFDNYLVTEALLIEFCRVLLTPNSTWKKPSETVGASSWTSALDFLQKPWEWGESLIQIQLFNLTLNTRETLKAYEQHSKWPLEQNQVRPPFRCLYHFTDHIVQILTKIETRGGWLICQDIAANNVSVNSKQFTVLTV